MEENTCVIYKIRNKINNKIYIGSTLKTFLKRIYNHKNALKNNKHYNKHLQSAWKIYGSESFEFSIIEKVIESKLIEREQYWIDYYKSYDGNIGYNICKIAGNTTGRIHSSETKNKISKALTGRKSSLKGKKLSEETITKRSITYKKNENKNPHSLETINKMKNTKTIKYGKKISQFDLNNNKISDFNSIKQASEKTNIHLMLIYKVLSGKYKKTHNFIFKYT